MEAEDAEDFDAVSYDVEATSKKTPLPAATITTITNEQQTELKTVTGVVSGEAANSGEEKLLVSTYLRSLSTDSTCNVIEMIDGDGSGSKLLPSPSPPQCNHNHNHIHHNHHLLQHHGNQNHRRLCEDGGVGDGDDDKEEDELKRKIKRKAMVADANNQMEPIVIHANKGMFTPLNYLNSFLYLKILIGYFKSLIRS